VNISNGRIDNSNLTGDFSPHFLRVQSSSNVTVTASRFPGSTPSALVKDSERITFTNNAMSRFLEIDSSTNVSVQGNVFSSIAGILLRGTAIAHFASHTVTPDNLVDGFPVLYRAWCTNESIDGQVIGQVIVANCDRVRIANVSI